MKPKIAEIEQTVIVSGTPEEVYEAFMDAKKHTKFTGSKATSNPVIGGKFTAWDGYIAGKNLDLKKGKLIVQEWVDTDWPEGYPPSRLELTLKKVPEGTEIHMSHSQIPASRAEELKEGWNEFYWEPMKKYFLKQKVEKKTEKIKPVRKL